MKTFTIITIVTVAALLACFIASVLIRLWVDKAWINQVEKGRRIIIAESLPHTPQIERLGATLFLISGILSLVISIIRLILIL